MILRGAQNTQGYPVTATCSKFLRKSNLNQRGVGIRKGGVAVSTPALGGCVGGTGAEGGKPRCKCLSMHEEAVKVATKLSSQSGLESHRDKMASQHSPERARGLGLYTWKPGLTMSFLSALGVAKITADQESKLGAISEQRESRGGRGCCF